MRIPKAMGLAMGLAAVSLVSACTQKSEAVDTAKVESEVRATVDATIAAFNAKDAEKATSMDAPDYVGMFHGAANIVGPEQDLAVTREQLASLSAPLEVGKATVDVSSAGDMAVWAAPYVYQFTDAKTKAPTVEHGNWVLVFKRQADGTMKVRYGIVSDTPAPDAAPGAN